MEQLEQLPVYAIATGVVALVDRARSLLPSQGAPEGNEAMARIARYIREGAMAFLAREYKVLAIYARRRRRRCSSRFTGHRPARGAAPSSSGAFLSLLAGFFGMKAATYAQRAHRPKPRARTASRPRS